MVKHTLRKGSIRPPQNHESISPATQEVVSRRIEMHVPDSLCVAAILGKQDLQSETPKSHLLVHTPSDEVELV